MWHPGHTALPKLLVASRWHRFTCEDLPGLPSNFHKAVKQSMGQKTGGKAQVNHHTYPQQCFVVFTEPQRMRGNWWSGPHELQGIP